MFISLSKTIARFGGFRLGVGMRLTGKNSSWLSIILLIVIMFQLIWSLLILCGWIIYAIIYAICWCIRKNKNKSSKKQNTIQISQDNRKEGTPDMTPEINNSTNPETTPPKKNGNLARWIIGGVFALIAISNGFHYSTLFLLCAAFLMLPFSFVQEFLSERNIKASVAIVLSVALFLVGAIVSPPSESSESTSNDTAQTTTKDDDNKDSTSKPNNSVSNNNTKPNNSSSNNNSSEKPNNSNSNNTNKEEEKVVMVWIVSTGTKYHSKSTCSQMTSPQKVTIDEAKDLGYTACQKCH